jgi:hypothetical protein
MKKTLIGAAALCFAISGAVQAQESTATCDDLVWSAQVLADNPDIAMACQGVVEKNGELYAKVEIVLTRVRGNRLTFRPMHTDGTRGSARSVTVESSFRANIAGRNYRARELSSGQELNVYMPQDRFALAVHDGEFDGDEEMLTIEEAAVVAVAMPKTASPLYSIFAGALVLLGLGATLSYRRKLART